MQVSTEELIKEVENSIAEFKRSKQEYDQDRVQEQVSMTLAQLKNFSFSFCSFTAFTQLQFLETEYYMNTIVSRKIFGCIVVYISADGSKHIYILLILSRKEYVVIISSLQLLKKTYIISFPFRYKTY